MAAADQWQLDGELVYNAGGQSFQGIASWGNRICIRLNGYDYRFRALYLDRFGERKGYLLPGSKTPKNLPDIDLGEGELSLLIEMADSISAPSAGQEYFEILKNPLRKATQARVHESRMLDWSSEEFIALLESYSELLQCLTAALDSQLRALKKLRNAPVGLYNFLYKPKDAAAREWLLIVLRAIAFSTESSEYPGPIVEQDLDAWDKCYRRLTIIDAASRDLIRPVLDDLQQRDRLRKCGDHQLPLAPTLPISVSKSAVCSPFCVDIQLSEGLAPLSGYQQDLLRAAMGKVLSTETADKAYRRWEAQMRSPQAYRQSGFEAWRRALAEQMVDAWFGSTELAKQAEYLLLQFQQQQEDEEKRRSAAIRSAYEYLVDTARYERRITELPRSRDEATELLSDEFFAFRYAPTKGQYKGHKLLVFDKNSLQRLLRSISVEEELYDAVLDFCEKEGFLVCRDHSITLGGETFHGITFRCQI